MVLAATETTKTILNCKNRRNVKETTIFISKDCERIIKPSLQRYLDYIYADGKIVAIHVYNTTANADSIYYVQTDLLGSWERVVDGRRNVVQSSHFDPWGNRMNATNWTQRQNVVDLPFHRGFTGHEHYDRFGIINMNARLYDPVLARFFSPDPQVQSPYSTQGFNRYSYCGNNPVMCTDPDGETTVVGSWLWGFIYGFVTAKDNRLETAWNSANQHALNNIKILCGLFTTNSNYSFWGRAWELASRFTWQAPQTILGWEYAQWCNYDIIHGGIKNIEYYDGATVITNNDSDWGAVTLGSYICGNSSLKADPNNSLFQHEFGHYLQSQEMGLAYLGRVGIPSLFSSHDHKHHPIEIDANRRSFMYFNKNVPGFYSSQDDWDSKDDSYFGWDFTKNPLTLKLQKEYVDYNTYNPSYIHAGWYDYLAELGGSLGVLIDGLALTFYYNNIY